MLSLKNNIEALQEIFESFPQMIIVIDIHDNIQYMNKKACTILEYTKEELYNKNWITTCLPIEEQNRVGAVSSVLFSDTCYDAFNVFDNYIITKNKKRYLMRWKNNILYGKDSVPVGILSIGEDITDAIYHEKELEVYKIFFSYLFTNNKLELEHIEDYLMREIHILRELEDSKLKIETITIALVSVLENANLLNDKDTGEHLRRISKYSEALAIQIGCDKEFIKKIRLYAPLHDVGKVGIPDIILKKPGLYTENEYEQKKQHVIIGAKILNNPEIDTMAYNIAKYHHERWDGNGYIKKLEGHSIPLEARVVAICDVYDALISERVYKKAIPKDKALEIINSESVIIF